MKNAILGFVWPLALLLPGAAAADEVSLCFNYSCNTEQSIAYSDARLAAVAGMLAAADNAERERNVLAMALGLLYGWAGEVSPIAADRGGNAADDDALGRMDCIDHSTSTTRLLRMLEARGMLRFHRVLEPIKRVRYVVAQHFSAVIEETALAERGAANAQGDEPRDAERNQGPLRFAMDSWYYDNGMAAVVLPLQQWLEGAGPDV